MAFALSVSSVSITPPRSGASGLRVCIPSSCTGKSPAAHCPYEGFAEGRVFRGMHLPYDDGLACHGKLRDRTRVHVYVPESTRSETTRRIEKPPVACSAFAFDF